MSDISSKVFLYIGSWEHDRGQKELGIRAFGLSKKGMEFIGHEAPDVCIGAMYLDSKKRILYCTDETEDYPNPISGGGGRVLAFSLDPYTGKMTRLSEVPAYGPRTSDVVIDDQGKYLLVTNHGSKRAITRTEQNHNGEFEIRLEYDETNIVMYKLEENGSIGKVADIHRHSGCGTKNPYLQAHPHCVRRSPLSNLFCVCDKGSDSIYLYQIDYQSEKIVTCSGSPYFLGNGCSPRYCVYHPTSPYFYINYEGTNKLTAFQYKPDGAITMLQTVTVIPEKMEFTFKGGKKTVQSSDIRIHPNGRYLYNITRGVNQIDVYQICPDSGMLTHEQSLILPVSQGGMDTIRAFTFLPDAKHLIVGALADNQILFLNVNENGTLNVSKEKTLDFYHPAAFAFM